MNTKKFIFLILFILFSQLIVVNSVEDKSFFNYLNFVENNSLDYNKISYELLYDKNNLGKFNFNLDIIYNKKTIGNCNKIINMDKNSIFKKITCDVKKVGNGDYKFIASISKDNNLISKIENIRFIDSQIIEIKNLNNNKSNTNSNLSSSISFKVYENKTVITLNILEVGKNLKIYSRIPKEVIENLNNDNKNELIISKLKYEIIESDPLISWNIKSSPIKINYTINKKIEEKNMKKFNLEIKETSSFKYFKYFIIFLTLFILIIIFKPMFKNKK